MPIQDDEKIEDKAEILSEDELDDVSGGVHADKVKEGPDRFRATVKENFFKA